MEEALSGAEITKIAVITGVAQGIGRRTAGRLMGVGSGSVEA